MESDQQQLWFSHSLIQVLLYFLFTHRPHHDLRTRGVTIDSTQDVGFTVTCETEV